MKPGLLCAVAGLVLALPIRSDEPQPQVILGQGPAGSWNADWEGVAGRTYFLQCGTNLESWQFAPIIEFGTGAKSHGIICSGPELFLRLVYADDPTVTNVTEAGWADPDGDGLPSSWELANGMNPGSADDYAAFLAEADDPPAPDFEVFSPLQ